METFLKLVATSGFANLGFGNVIMFVVAGTLIYLAVTKGYEPLLLIPIGFGILITQWLCSRPRRLPLSRCPTHWKPAARQKWFASMSSAT